MDFFSQATLLAALAVVIVHQILKLKFIPLTLANKYPVPTNIVLSIVASVAAVWQSKVPTPTVWTEWVLLVTLISVVSAIVYNSTIHSWKELRAMEG